MEGGLWTEIPHLCIDQPGVVRQERGQGFHQTVELLWGVRGIYSSSKGFGWPRLPLEFVGLLSSLEI